MDKILFSSESIIWETPQYLFDKYNNIYKFDIDVCANKNNNKCLNYFSPEIDGLKQKWKGNCWMNPPYGKEINKWIQKAYEECFNGVTTVSLLPSRTDTKWFHDYIYYKKNVNIEFIKGRLKFGNSKNSAPFPSMICIFNSLI